MPKVKKSAARIGVPRKAKLEASIRTFLEQHAPAPTVRIIDEQHAAGWQGNSWEPKPSQCKQCGRSIPPTKRRGAAFGGYGRPRELCSARCRKRWSRAGGAGKSQ